MWKCSIEHKKVFIWTSKQCSNLVQPCSTVFKHCTNTVQTLFKNCSKNVHLNTKMFKCIDLKDAFFFCVTCKDLRIFQNFFVWNEYASEMTNDYMIDYQNMPNLIHSRTSTIFGKNQFLFILQKTTHAVMITFSRLCFIKHFLCY